MSIPRRHRPLVAVPGRFSASASALRYGALVNAQALLRLVHAAGGEPLTVLPVAPGGRVDPDDVAARLGFADAVLLPGGADVDPARYGQRITSDEVYDVDAEQDAFDLAVARWALDAGMPMLAVCRGMHVVNVAEGGTLEQHMADPHRHVVHDADVAAGSLLAKVTKPGPVQVSCFHHQRLAALAPTVLPTATAADGTIEAVERTSGGWFLGVQWHPEDTYLTDECQLAMVRAFVDAAR
jgi:putative glutamine amidotransferase